MLKVYVEPLPEFSYVYCQDGLNTTLLSQGRCDMYYQSISAKLSYFHNYLTILKETYTTYYKK